MADQEPEIVDNSIIIAKELSDVSRGGRPTAMTIEVVRKLLEAFTNGYNITEAVSYAGIGRQTYYDWLRDDDKFSYRMSQAQAAPNLKAKELVIGAMISGDVSTARWWLERKDPEFKNKGEVIIDPTMQRTEEKLKEFLDDTDDNAYPDSVYDDRGEPATTTEPEGGDEVAPSPTDLS